MDISFSKVTNGGGVATAIAWIPNGNIFKNGSVASLTAECDLWKNGAKDTTTVLYQWYNQDPSVVTDQGGGVGWRKLTSSANSGETGYTTNTITIPSGAVVDFEVYKCVITDNDPASSTYNKTFADTVSFVDQSDPIQVTVESSGGNIFKNGSGSTTLTAKLFRAGAEIDSAGTGYTYHWFKYDSSGTLVTGWGGSTDYKAGKTLTVGSADVSVKATFICQIS